MASLADLACCFDELLDWPAPAAAEPAPEPAAAEPAPEPGAAAPAPEPEPAPAAAEPEPAEPTPSRLRRRARRAAAAEPGPAAEPAVATEPAEPADPELDSLRAWLAVLPPLLQRQLLRSCSRLYAVALEARAHELAAAGASY